MGNVQCLCKFRCVVAIDVCDCVVVVVVAGRGGGGGGVCELVVVVGGGGAGSDCLGGEMRAVR